MTIPVVTFFNNKGGVGKTSLVYHVAWMLSEMGRRVLVLDLDPQANLTAAFWDEDALTEIWAQQRKEARTIADGVKPLAAVGDLEVPDIAPITGSLGLIPGDLALAGFEDTLAEQWPHAMGSQNLFRPFRVLTAFWTIAQEAAREFEAEIILFDVGPNLGAINRSALIATDFVVVPLAGDLFSIQGLRNLGPTLERWREDWKERLKKWARSAERAEHQDFSLPKGKMKPVGYIVQQHQVRLDRPVWAYTLWMDRIPEEYRRHVLGDSSALPSSLVVEADPQCIGMLKHFRSLVPMAQEARRPVFNLRPADGAIGAHAGAVQMAYQDYRKLTEAILARVGLPGAGPGRQPN